MATKDNLSSTDIVILCGGLGTRLKGLFPNQPKALVRFGERTFLDILLNQLKQSGFKRFILCVGHLKEQIEEHCRRNYQDIEIIFSEEDAPLGTGGAIKKAQGYIKSNPFLVLNGDSLCRVDFKDLYNLHLSKDPLLTMVLSHPGSREDGGNVLISKDQRIIKFNEKTDKRVDSFISAGIYCLDQRIFSYLPKADSFSIENDVFPNVLSKKCFGFFSNSDVIDIGTIERYTAAVPILSTL